MPLQLENHNAAGRWLSRPIASLALVATLLVLVPSSSAQSHTTSSSAGHTSASASTTHSTSWSSASTTRTAPSSTSSHNNAPIHHSRGYWRGGVYYPYIVGGSGAADSSTATGNGDAECQGGPTVFDGCSSAPGSYIPPTNEGPAHGSMSQSGFAGPANSASDSANPTTLVFKDGREVEVDNYAVAGQTLYDLTPGRSQKIALSDLDLSATQKQNHDHGAAFELPPSHSN